MRRNMAFFTAALFSATAIASTVPGVPSAAASTASGTTTTTSRSWPELTFTRLGIGPEGSAFLATGKATRNEFRAVLGLPDATKSHPATPCYDAWGGRFWEDKVSASFRWGDLTVNFKGSRMVGYRFGPKYVGVPSGAYAGAAGPVRLNDPMSVLLAERGAAVESTRTDPWGYQWLVVGYGTGIRGFASGPRGTGTVVLWWVGAACF